MVRIPKSGTRADLKETDILLRCGNCGFPSYADQSLFKEGQEYIIGKCSQCGRNHRQYMNG